MQKSFFPRFSFFYPALLLLSLPGRTEAISEEEFFQAAMIDDRVQGQITASGIRYERDSLVATHPYLPFGTRIQITNLENEKVAVAEIIDRPRPVFHSVGLSAAVAQVLGIPPLTPVEVSVTTRLETPVAQMRPKTDSAHPTPGRTIPVAYRPAASFQASQQPAATPAPSAASFRLQFGSFADPDNANLMQRSLTGLGIPAVVSTSPGGAHYRVLSRSTYENSAQAQSVANLMIQRGLIREAIAVH